MRSMKRSAQAVFAEGCRKILIESKRAVLLVIGDDGYPYGISVNFYYDPRDDVICLHGVREGYGSMLSGDAIRSASQPWIRDTRSMGLDRHVMSIMVKRKAELIDNISVAKDKVCKRGMKYSRTRKRSRETSPGDIKGAADRDKVEEISGKPVHEK